MKRAALRFSLLFLFLFLAALAWAQTAATPVPVPVDQEPRHHLFLENAYVRVFKVEVAPLDRTLLHQHDRDYVFVTLGESDVINARLGEPARELKLKDGDTAYAKGGFAHVAINAAKTPFRNVTIELVKPKPDTSPEPWETLAGAGMGVTEMVDNERVHAELIELMPGATTPLHTHKRPHLVVLLTDITLENDVAGKKSTITKQAGDVDWVDPGLTHTLKNIGARPARWVGIEIR
jgi:quercetin dioxygenase-like cupin family protein